MFWKKKKPSLEGEENYMAGDPDESWACVEEIDYLMHSPYVKQSLLETELHYKSAALLLLLREEEKLGRERAELNGGITIMLKETEDQLAVVDAALQELARMKWEHIDNESPELLKQLEAIIEKRCPEWAGVSLSTVEDEIRYGLVQLGYNVKDDELKIERLHSGDDYRVTYEGEYVGVWSASRYTFID